MEKKEYLELVESLNPPKNLKKNLIGSFLVGGFISALGELMRQYLLNQNFCEDDAAALVSIILIVFTAVLTGFGIFHHIANFAGAGSFVPITGFANSIVSPALEFKTEGYIFGVASRMFIIAGPVIVYGIFSSIICGFVFYLIEFFGGTL